MAAFMFDYKKLSAQQKRIEFNKIIRKTLTYNPSFKGTWYSWQLSHFSKTWGEKPGRVLGAFLNNNNKVLEIYDSLDIGGIKETKGYHLMMKSKREKIFEPYRDYKINVLETTLAYPIVNNGSFAGIVGIDIDLKHFQDIAQKIKLYKTGYAFILSNKGRYVYHPQKQVIDSTFALINPAEDKEFEISKKIQEGKEIQFYGIYSGSNDGILAFFTPIKIGNTGTPWSLGVLVFMNEVMAKSNIIIRNTLITGILGLAILLIILLTVTNYAFRSINKGIMFAKKISEGDLTAKLKINSKDEMGELSKALNIMIKHFKEMILDMRKSALQMEEFAEEINASTQDYELIADRQKQSAELIGDSINNISTNIELSHNNTVSTEMIAKNAMKKLNEGNKLVGDTIKSMNEIANHISIIGEIAERTDILAINASIEASRAGDAGKGFSVVAQEVRQLSEQSSKAANQINEISLQGVSISASTGEMINQLYPEMEKTATLIKEIAHSSYDQTKEIQEIVHTLENFSTISEENLSMAKKMGHSAESFQELSLKLNSIIRKFKI